MWFAYLLLLLMRKSLIIINSCETCLCIGTYTRGLRRLVSFSPTEPCPFPKVWRDVGWYYSDVGELNPVRIGSTNALFARPPGAGGGLSARSGARRRGAQHGVAWVCGRLDLRLRGFPVRGSRDDRLGTAGGDDCKRDCKAHRGAIPRRCAHGAYEITPRVVGLVNPAHGDSRRLAIGVARHAVWHASREAPEDMDHGEQAL